MDRDGHALDSQFHIARPQWMALVAALGVGLLAITTVAVTFVAATDITGYVMTMMLHGAVYVVACIFVLRARPSPSFRHDVWMIVGLAIAIRLIAMAAPPNLTTDAYRYVWDGRLILEGISPYLFVPADPQLEHLRDQTIFPFINKKEIAHTIYPPVAQFMFAVGVFISDGLTGQKLVMFASELVIIGCLIGWLSLDGLPKERVLIYAWHPLPIWEFSSQAHLDATIAAFIAAAILATRLRKQGLAGGLLAGGFLMKYYPIILIPALWRRWDWRMPVIFVGVAALAYLPFLPTAGWKVFGFLSSHLGNEGYRAGWGFHVLWGLRDFKIADPPVHVYLALALTCLAVIAALALFRRGREEIQPEMIALIGAAFVFFTSPHYPWYAAFLVVVLVRVPHPALMAMTIFAIVLQTPRGPNDLSWTHLYALAYWLPVAIWMAHLMWPLAGRVRTRD